MYGKQTRVDVREYETDDEDVFWDIPRRRLVKSSLKRLESSCLVVSVTIEFLLLLLLHSGCTGYSSYLKR